jgi:hypothetical protein
LKAVNQQGVSSDAKPLLKQRDEPINEIGTFIWHVQSNKLVRHIDGGNENDEISGDIRPLAPLSTHCKW